MMVCSLYCPCPTGRVQTLEPARSSVTRSLRILPKAAQFEPIATPQSLQTLILSLNLVGMNLLSLERLPSTNSLFLDFIGPFDRVADLYPGLNYVREAGIPHRDQLCDVLLRQNESFGNPATHALLQKFRQNGTRCVITGQQIGLLTGPLYTIWKALTMIHLAAEYEKAGIPCIPIFWMATEDHNMHEIASFALLKQDLDLLTFSLKEHLFLRRQPAGTIGVDDPEIRKILIRVFHELKRPEIRQFYSEGTLTHGFSKTLLWLLRDFPILLIDPSDPSLKQIATPFFEKFFRHSEDLMTLLWEQNARLKARNYPVQVQMEEDRLPIFKIENNERTPLSRGLHQSRNPDSLSPSALLRPLFQDYLFPTVAYVGGPAEIAYFAQIHPWYTAMEIDQPSLLPRASMTLIPPSTRSFLDARNLKPHEIYLQEDTLIDALLDHEGMKETRNEIRNLGNTLQTALNAIQTKAMSIDPTLKKSLHMSGRKMEYQLQKMERKAFLAAKRKNVLLAEQIRKARNVIYPNEKLQERYLNAFSFSSRLPELIQQLYGQIRWQVKAHQYIDL